MKEIFHKQIFFMIMEVFWKVSPKKFRKNIVICLVVKTSYVLTQTISFFKWQQGNSNLQSLSL